MIFITVFIEIQHAFEKSYHRGFTYGGFSNKTPFNKDGVRFLTAHITYNDIRKKEALKPPRISALKTQTY